jgi:hypothetical protein
VLTRNEHYLKRRSAILARFWQDELLVLILRAMSRGTEGSLCQSRIDRRAEPAQILLSETRRIYHGIQREIFAARELGPLHRIAIVLAVASTAFVVLGLVVTLARAVAR